MNLNRKLCDLPMCTKLSAKSTLRCSLVNILLRRSRRRSVSSDYRNKTNRVESHDFKFTIAANLITGTEIKLRTPRKLNFCLPLFRPSACPLRIRKDGFSTHKLHTISFKRITNLPSKVRTKQPTKKV